jgi:hypothetical protein
LKNPPALGVTRRLYFWQCRRRRCFFEGRQDGDEQAAYAVAEWLQRAERSGSLESFFTPLLTAEERQV